MKIILKVNSENIIEDIGESYETIPSGYKEYLFENYPNDLTTQTYKLINGIIIRDENLYAIYLENKNALNIDDENQILDN